jgi:hypothetical protein
MVRGALRSIGGAYAGGRNGQPAGNELIGGRGADQCSQPFAIDRAAKRGCAEANRRHAHGVVRLIESVGQ